MVNTQDGQKFLTLVLNCAIERHGGSLETEQTTDIHGNRAIQ